MGHDITAIRKSAPEELSYIRIGAWNRHKAYMLYEALSAHNCNGGVSGNGGEKEFTPDELKIILAKFKYMLGEPRDQIIAEMESSEGAKAADEFMRGLMKALMAEVPEKSESDDDDDIKYNNEDILRFLTEIQVDEPVVIQFY
jgi:hypothetical protein